MNKKTIKIFSVTGVLFIVILSCFLIPHIINNTPKHNKILSYNQLQLNNELTVMQVEYEWNEDLLKRNYTNTIVLHHASIYTCTVEDIHKWHQNQGMIGIGYHYLVKKDGTIYTGRPEDTIGAHALGSNSESIGICFEGNYNSTKTMPKKQIIAGNKLIKYLQNKYEGVSIKKHSDVCNDTNCPGKYFPFDEFI